MTPEERLDRIEADIDKQNQGIQALIVVARTTLDSFKELREADERLSRKWEKLAQKLAEAQAATEEKLNILIDTVDRILRDRNGRNPELPH